METPAEFTNFQEPNSSMLYNQPDFEDNFFTDLKGEQEFLSKELNDDYALAGGSIDSANPFSQHDQMDFANSQDQNNQHKRTRASGEVLALLIDEFNKNPNPNAQIRKKISDQTGMPERSVRIWFQNRRAKSRKLEKAQAIEGDDRYGNASPRDAISSSKYDGIPLHLNNSYFFIDARSLTVGSWKRLKSGNLLHDNIFSVRNLSNLSPLSINEILNNSTDLMIVISKKNFEINYFFSAITDNSKVLFRIFFPISSVTNCSLSICTEEDEKGPTCESKIYLNKPPKFAVSFSNSIRPDNNQWSICDDFSEGHQVNDAFIGGSGIPHVFHGLEPSLKFMNSFILDYNSSNIRQQEFALPHRFSTKSPTFFNDPTQNQPELQQLPHEAPHQPPHQAHQIPQQQIPIPQHFEQSQQHQELYQRNQFQGDHTNNLSPQMNINDKLDDNPLLHQFVKQEFIDDPDTFDVFHDDNPLLVMNSNDQLHNLNPQ